MAGSAGSKYGIVTDGIPTKTIPILKPLVQWVCADCGKLRNERATWHEGKCDVCGLTKPVTERRDFSTVKLKDSKS